MTVSVKVHVNGNYRATCKSFVDGVEQGEPVVVNHGEEKTLPHQHGKTNTYEVSEEPVKNEAPQSEPDDEAAASEDEQD